MQLKVNDKTFNLLEESARDELMAGHRRKVLTLHISGSNYAELDDTLTDGVVLTVVDDLGDEYQHAEYSKAGSITDNRDGTYTCKMGYPNTIEQDLQDKVSKSTEIITTIVGKSVQSVEDANAVRADVESLFAASSMDDDGKIRADYLCPAWKNGNHNKGENYTANGQVWECYQAYDNATYPDIVPDNPSWYTFNRPLHGSSPEAARLWVAPQGAHDMYQTGEYMIYNGKVYKCVESTNFNPDEYARAWEVQD